MLDNLNFMTGSIFFLGSTTVILSLLVAYYFFKYKRKLTGKAQKLSSSIGFQLIGEAVIGLGTLTFAVGAHFGFLDYWSTSAQSAIRFTMFFATSATTLHLLRTLKKIEDNEHS